MVFSALLSYHRCCRHSTSVATKGVDLTGLLGDIKENWRSEGSFFYETTHNICIKIQQTTVDCCYPLSLGIWTSFLVLTRVDILNDITSKILGGYITMDCIHIGGHVPLSHRDLRPWSQLATIIVKLHWLNLFVVWTCCALQIW